MCGIVGVLDTRRSATTDDLHRTVKRMADRLYHRGPDGEGTWVDGAAGLALGHRRLAIIDLSDRGRQPMVSADGRYVITYNGEVYNFPELRTDLTALGHRFSGGSDTEVMLAACLEWGIEEALARFVGMFAFGLWDRQKRRLTLARDRLGVKPLYWSWQRGLLLFGSELTALETHPGFDTEIDREAVAAVVRSSYIPAPASIYRHARKLPPGSILVLEPGGEPAVHAYWRLGDRIADPDGARPPLDDREATDQLGRLIAESVRQRMISDVPLGAFLSGGIDSSTVVAFMQQQSARKVRTFSIGFNDAQLDEAVHARAVAKHLGTDHTELYVGERHVLDVVPKLTEFFDEPFADSSQIPTYVVSAMTRDHVTVALSGDGGDEMFAGYPKYAAIAQVWGRLGWMPGGIRGLTGRAMRTLPVGIWNAASRLIPPRRRPQLLGQRAHRLGAILNLPGNDDLYGHLSAGFRDEGALVPGSTGALRHRPDPGLPTRLPDLVSRMQYYDTLSYLPDDIMVKVDRCSMAVSLEAREPLLDHRLIEFVWSLPLHMKLRGGTSKWLLREVLHRYVPRTLTDRPKMGFSVPLAEWLRGPLRSWAEDLLTPAALAAGGLFDTSKVRGLWSAHACGRADYQKVLWSILMTQSWLKHRHATHMAA